MQLNANLSPKKDGRDTLARRGYKRKLILIPSVSGRRKNDISESQKKKSKDAVSEDKNPD
jgi:hypothetical protein